MDSANQAHTATISIVSLLFTHGIAHAMESMAQCMDSDMRVRAASEMSRVLRSGKFINDDPDKPIVFASPDWQVPLEQLYYLWVDVMDGKVVDSKPMMSLASLVTRSGFAAVFLRAFVDGPSATVPLSAENLYDVYANAVNDVQGANGRLKSFSKLGEPVRRAWLAVATAIARLNDQVDPCPEGVPMPSVIAALRLVTDRFGPPKPIAA